MDHGQLGMVADKGQWVCADTRLNACGQVAQLRRRQRPLTPFRSLGTNLLATHSPRNRALAGLHMALAGGITGSNMDILREEHAVDSAPLALVEGLMEAAITSLACQAQHA